LLTKLKNSGQVYNSPNYRNILHEYWNNGTHQVENPDPIVEEAMAVGRRNMTRTPEEEATNTNDQE
jgi:hypothetical protein